jgi:hypothetical protein
LPVMVFGGNRFRSADFRNASSPASGKVLRKALPADVACMLRISERPLPSNESDAAAPRLAAPKNRAPRLSRNSPAAGAQDSSPHWELLHRCSLAPPAPAPRRGGMTSSRDMSVSDKRRFSAANISNTSSARSTIFDNLRALPASGLSHSRPIRTCEDTGLSVNYSGEIYFAMPKFWRFLWQVL